MLVFSTPQYDYLKQSFLDIAEEGKLEWREFLDGEVYTRILSKVDHEDVVFIAGLVSDRDFLNVFDICCAITKLGAKSLSIIVPFMSYTTMERATKEGEVVRAKTRARLLSSIPQAYQGNQILFLELHNDSLAHYFEGNITAKNISSEDLIIEKIKELNLSDYTLLATDEGGAKKIRKMADKLNVDLSFLIKRRKFNTVSSKLVIDVETDTVIIYDDMIRSGNTLVEALEKVKDKNIYVFTTHARFVDGALEKIKKYTNNIYATNSLVHNVNSIDISKLLKDNL